ncbi:hypothetical protein [Paeniglutamicibacter antarcticus]|uniref:hypothetical protein n=1 Tax=Paeniglutamicibacter antarcticus TaxID=494023 RepID=UPI001AE1D1ED
MEAALHPAPKLGFDATQLCDHRVTAVELSPGLDDSGIEVLNQVMFLGGGTQTVHGWREFGLFRARHQCRLTHAYDVPWLHHALDPPVRVRFGSQPRDGFARVGEILEVFPGKGSSHGAIGHFEGLVMGMYVRCGGRLIAVVNEFRTRGLEIFVNWEVFTR